MGKIRHEIKPKVLLETHKYRGKWVALTRDRLICVGDSSTEVYEEDQRQGVKIPIIYRVPEADTAHFYFASM